jgi:hypothetical protein
VTFLNPFALLALSAVGIPLLLHFFNLRQPQTVDFSSLAFVKELQKSAVQRVRVKEWLLLLLRMLAVACLVLAFARPTLTGQLASVGQRVRTAHAVVVDNSLSMTLRDDQGAYLDQAKRQARGILETAEAGDDVLVWPTAQSRERLPAPGTNLSVARQALDDVAPTAGAAPLSAAVVQAAQRLQESTAPRKVVYAVSDLQQSTLGDSSATTAPEGSQGIVVPVGTRTHANVGITDVRVVSRIAEVGQPVEMEATLANYGSEPLNGYVASVYLQDERVAQATTALQPGQTTTVSFTATPQSRGWLAGRVEGEDDVLPQDNVRHFTLHVPQERRILVVRGEEQPTEYLDLALSSQMVEDRIAFRTTTIAEADLTTAELGSYDTVLLVGPRTLSSGEVSALQRYVEQGGGVMLFPNNQARPEDYNALLSALNGGEFRGFSGSIGEQRAIATFDRVDREHPLFEGVFDPSQQSRRAEVERPDVYYAMNYRPAGASEQTLIQLSNGFPFLQEIRHGSGVALTLAVAPTPQWSDLPVRGLFIPLLYRSVYYLSAGTSVAGEQLTAGRAGELRITGLPPETSALRLVGPNGVERTPDQRSLYGATLLQTGANLHTPGIYDIWAADTLVRRIAVNLAARESDVRTVVADSAAAQLGRVAGMPVRAIGSEASTAASVAETLRTQRTGTEIWNVFLLLALIFLLAEMLVASQWKPETVPA